MNECAGCGCARLPQQGARGLCRVCYGRARRRGTLPTRDGRRSQGFLPTAEQRIDNFIVRMPNDCWIWTGPRRGLYGSTSIDGRATLVHRFQYERYVAPIPDGLQIDHLCREELCCNPRHLEPVTPQENTLRSPFSRGSINGRKTHCPQGHPYDVANTYGNINSGRLCRPCNLARVARKRVAGSEQVSA